VGDISSAGLFYKLMVLGEDVNRFKPLHQLKDPDFAFRGIHSTQG